MGFWALVSFHIKGKNGMGIGARIKIYLKIINEITARQVQQVRKHMIF
jgi:hypothetical protein